MRCASLDRRSEAADVLRGATDYIEMVLVEINESMRHFANLYGEAAEILSLAENLTRDRPENAGVTEICTKTVLGRGFPISDGWPFGADQTVVERYSLPIYGLGVAAAAHRFLSASSSCKMHLSPQLS